MKILILGSYPIQPFAKELSIDPNTITRITSWNEKLAEELAKLPNTEVHVITGTTAINHEITVSNSLITVSYLPMNKWKNRLTFFKYLHNKATRLINQFSPDIIHGIGTEHLWPYIAVNSNYPSVVTVHGIISEVVKKSPPKRFSQQRFFAWLEPRVLKQTKHLISINPYITDTLSKYTSAQCYSIENPIRELFFEEYSNPEDNDYMLFVGSIEHRKGIHILLDAYSALKKKQGAPILRLILAGPILSKEYGELLQSKIEKYGLEKDVKFAGFMMPDDLSKMYSKAAFLVLPSYEETAPMCIAEAMAVGIPVIATNVGGVKHMIIENETGYIIEAGDVSTLQDRIDRLYNTPENRRKMGKRAKQVANKRWLSPMIAVQTRNVYQKILSKK